MSEANSTPRKGIERMDWKYKHFHQARLYPAGDHVVRDAARTFMRDSLGFQIVNETADGFRVEGYSFGHRAIAELRFPPAANGTSVNIELAVERAGVTGFMLFDVGGYYNIQIRHWLDGIQGLIHQNLTGSQDAAQVAAPPPRNKTAACVFNGCLGFIVVMFAVWAGINVITSVVGLITGNLVLIGRGNPIHLHGLAARIVSVIVLLFGAWILWRLMKMRRSSRPVI